MKKTKKPLHQELLASDAEQLDQAELVEAFKSERLKLEEAHRDRVRAAELKHQAALVDLDRRQLAALGELWKKQGRQLGPGMLRAMEVARGSSR